MIIIGGIIIAVIFSIIIGLYLLKTVETNFKKSEFDYDKYKIKEILGVENPKENLYLKLIDNIQGEKILKFQQIVNNKLVYGNEIILTFNDEKNLTNKIGEYLLIDDEKLKYNISYKEGINIATEDSSFFSKIKYEKCIYVFKDKTYKAAWKIEISSKFNIEDNKVIFINAEEGSIILQAPTIIK